MKFFPADCRITAAEALQISRDNKARAADNFMYETLSYGIRERADKGETKYSTFRGTTISPAVLQQLQEDGFYVVQTNTNKGARGSFLVHNWLIDIHWDPAQTGLVARALRAEK